MTRTRTPEGRPGKGQMVMEMPDRADPEDLAWQALSLASDLAHDIGHEATEADGTQLIVAAEAQAWALVSIAQSLTRIAASLASIEMSSIVR